MEILKAAKFVVNRSKSFYRMFVKSGVKIGITFVYQDQSSWVVFKICVYSVCSTLPKMEYLAYWLFFNAVAQVYETVY